MSEFESFIVERLKKTLKLEERDAERLRALLTEKCLSREEETQLEKLITNIEFKLFEQLDEEFHFELIESASADVRLLRDVLMLKDSAVLEADVTAVLFRFRVFFEMKESTLELIHFRVLDTLNINTSESVSDSDRKLASLVLS